MNAPSAAAETVLLRRDAAGVTRLTLNRPHARNTLSLALMVALDDEPARIAEDPDAKVVDAARAREIGLVRCVVPESELPPCCLARVVTVLLRSSARIAVRP